MPFGIGMPFGRLGTAAGAAGGILGVPWSIALPIIISLLGSTGIFGGKDEDEGMQEAMRLKQQMRMLGIPKPYQSPFLPAMDQATMTAILNQLKRTSNWGWPEGQQMDIGWIEDLLSRFAPMSTGRVPPGTKIRL